MTATTITKVMPPTNPALKYGFKGYDIIATNLVCP